jgi:hypothetical protein
MVPTGPEIPRSRTTRKEETFRLSLGFSGATYSLLVSFVKLFKEFGVYYERKLGEFSDGLRYGYVPTNLLVKREKLVRVALACDYRTNQTRSSTKKFFDQTALASLLKITEVAKYAYGYQVLELN